MSATVITVTSAPAPLLSTLGLTVTEILLPGATCPLLGVTGAKVAPLPSSLTPQFKSALPVFVTVKVCGVGLLPLYVVKLKDVFWILIAAIGGGITVKA